MSARILPESDAELMAMRALCGNDNTRTAEVYGCNESQVRKRVRRITGTAHRYVKLPKPVEELYAEWLATGTGNGSQAALARSYGVLPGTLRRAFRMYRERNSEEDERRERESDLQDAGIRAGVPRRAGVQHPRHQKHDVPQHDHGREVRRLPQTG